MRRLLLLLLSLLLLLCLGGAPGHAQQGSDSEDVFLTEEDLALIEELEGAEADADADAQAGADADVEQYHMDLPSAVGQRAVDWMDSQARDVSFSGVHPPMEMTLANNVNGLLGQVLYSGQEDPYLAALRAQELVATLGEMTSREPDREFEVEQSSEQFGVADYFKGSDSATIEMKGGRIAMSGNVGASESMKEELKSGGPFGDPESKTKSEHYQGPVTLGFKGFKVEPRPKPQKRKP